LSRAEIRTLRAPFGSYAWSKKQSTEQKILGAPATHAASEFNEQFREFIPKLKAKCIDKKVNELIKEQLANLKMQPPSCFACLHGRERPTNHNVKNSVGSLRNKKIN